MNAHTHSRAHMRSLIQAAVNLNFWLTPEDANLDKKSGGLVIYTQKPPAHWTFEQPTRGGLTSHFTYNEYPLETKYLKIEDETGIRTHKDYSWIRGNAEHSWGLLH